MLLLLVNILYMMICYCLKDYQWIQSLILSQSEQEEYRSS